MGKKERFALKLAQLNELSLVDNPANQHAKVILAKRMEKATVREKLTAALKRLLDSIGKDDTGTTSRTYDQLSGLQDLWDKNSTLMESIRSILTDPNLTDKERAAKVDETLAQFKSDIVKEVEKATKAAGTCAECGSPNGMPHTKDCSYFTPVEKKEPPPPNGDPNLEHDPMKKRTVPTFSTVEQASAFATTVCDELNAATEELTKLKVGTEQTEEELAKSMGPVAAAEVVRLRKQNAELVEKAGKAERISKAAEIAKGAITKAEELADLADLLKVAGEKGTALLTSVLKQLAATRKELTEIGDLVDDSPASEGSAQARLDKLVEEYQKANPKVSKAVAVTKVLENNTELYEELEEESGISDEPAPV